MKITLAALFTLLLSNFVANVALANPDTEILVKFSVSKLGIKNSLIAELTHEFGAKERHQYKIVNNLVLFEFPNFKKAKEATEVLEASNHVEYVQPNFYRYLPTHTNRKVLPNPMEDPAFPPVATFPKKWVEDKNLHENVTMGMNRTSRTFSEFKYYGDPKVTIAVVDTGVDYTHPDIVANLWRNKGEVGVDAKGQSKESNGVDDDGNGYIDDVLGWDAVNNDNKPFDDHYHGTHVAGIAAATGGNGIGISGNCPRCSVMSLKFITKDGQGTDADAIKALEYAAKNGADVINSSWGGKENSPALKETFRNIDAMGIINVIAAGNVGENISTIPFYPAVYDFPNQLTVAAFVRPGVPKLLFFSNHSRRLVHTASAGWKVLSLVPGPDQYDAIGGTSMAAPGVAGAVGLVKSYRPNLSNQEIRDLLNRFNVRSHDGSWGTKFGGAPNVYNIFKHLSKKLR